MLLALILPPLLYVLQKAPSPHAEAVCKQSCRRRRAHRRSRFDQSQDSPPHQSGEMRSKSGRACGQHSSMQRTARPIPVRCAEMGPSSRGRRPAARGAAGSDARSRSGRGGVLIRKYAGDLFFTDRKTRASGRCVPIMMVIPRRCERTRFLGGCIFVLQHENSAPYCTTPSSKLFDFALRPLVWIVSGSTER